MTNINIFRCKVKKLSVEEIKIIKNIYTDKTCGYCYYLKSVVSLWCYNKDAVKFRNTMIPGICNCKFWKPDKKYIRKKLKNVK